jgi:putative membrane protein
MDHLHTGGGPAATLVLALPAGLALILYLGATISQRRRGNAWPSHRAVLWLVGVAAASSGFVGPLAEAAHRNFTVHMITHVVTGMAAPVLLVLAAPVTLALRAMDVVPARRLARLLNSAPLRMLTNPIVAAVLNIGGLWLLYRTPLFAAMQDNPLLHAGVMAHVLVAGCLFTASIIPVDPAPHRALFPVRTAVLVLAFAAHGILAKSVYAHPPAGVAPSDAEAGALLMYYAGDVIDLVIITLLFAQWYKNSGRTLSRSLSGQPTARIPGQWRTRGSRGIQQP